MKKLLTVFLSMCLLLSCAFALGEGEAQAFDAVGLRLGFSDVSEPSPYYVNLASGTLSRSPFISVLQLQYFAIPRETMQTMLDSYDDYDEEKKLSAQQLVANARTILACVLVTDAGDPDEAFRAVLGKSAAEAGAGEFGRVDACRYFAVPMPGFTDPEEALSQGGMDPEKIPTDSRELTENGDRIRAEFLERVKSAELYGPAVPLGDIVGRVLSFETVDVDGNPVTSAELFRENKITMVNVWGIWCPHCVNELPELAAIHARLQEQGCGIVGVEWEGKPIETMREEIHAFLEEKGITYPNVVKPDSDPILDGVQGYPTTFFVDSEGRILIAPIEGADVAGYEAALDQLLNSVEEDADGEAAAVRNDSGEYRVIVRDGDGQPVEGATIQLCDEKICTFGQTGADGIAVFAVEEQKVYEVHVLAAPEGFAADDTVYKTLDTGSDVSIVLKKAE